MKPLRIAIVGAESTGKSSLTQALAEVIRLRGHAVQTIDEVLRTWCDREGRTPQPHEQLGIAQAQAQAAEQAEQKGAQGWVISDTTPLMTAVKLNHPEVVRLLLKAGANTQVKDRTGAGLLLVTINDDLPQVMAVLLGQGLDPNQPDADGLTPLYWARQLQREALATQLVNAGAQADVKRQALRASRPYLKEDF